MNQNLNKWVNWTYQKKEQKGLNFLLPSKTTQEGVSGEKKNRILKEINQKYGSLHNLRNSNRVELVPKVTHLDYFIKDQQSSAGALKKVSKKEFKRVH